MDSLIETNKHQRTNSFDLLGKVGPDFSFTSLDENKENVSPRHTNHKSVSIHKQSKTNLLSPDTLEKKGHSRRSLSEGGNWANSQLKKEPVNQANATGTVASSASSVHTVDDLNRTPSLPSKWSIKRATLYKTELCRAFEETGSCKFGDECIFAHSEEELRPRGDRHPKYKTKICRTFWEKGECPYGKRCCFIHTERDLSLAHHDDIAAFEAQMIAVQQQKINAANAAAMANGTPGGLAAPNSIFGSNHRRMQSAPEIVHKNQHHHANSSGGASFIGLYPLMPLENTTAGRKNERAASIRSFDTVKTGQSRLKEEIKEESDSELDSELEEMERLSIHHSNNRTPSIHSNASSHKSIYMNNHMNMNDTTNNMENKKMDEDKNMNTPEVLLMDETGSITKIIRKPKKKFKKYLKIGSSHKNGNLSSESAEEGHLAANLNPNVSELAALDGLPVNSGKKKWFKKKDKKNNGSSVNLEEDGNMSGSNSGSRNFLSFGRSKDKDKERDRDSSDLERSEKSEKSEKTEKEKSHSKSSFFAFGRSNHSNNNNNNSSATEVYTSRTPISTPPPMPKDGDEDDFYKTIAAAASGNNNNSSTNLTAADALFGDSSNTVEGGSTSSSTLAIPTIETPAALPSPPLEKAMGKVEEEKVVKSEESTEKIGSDEKEKVEEKTETPAPTPTTTRRSFIPSFLLSAISSSKN